MDFNEVTRPYRRRKNLGNYPVFLVIINKTKNLSSNPGNKIYFTLQSNPETSRASGPLTSSSS